jgi:hypothetical protein
VSRAGALTALYRSRVASITGLTVDRVTSMWLQRFDPDAAVATAGLVARQAGDWIATAQQATSSEAASYLAALTAEAAGLQVWDVDSFAVPGWLAGSSAAGIPVGDLAGIAPGAYIARLAAGASPAQAAGAAVAWLGRLATSEPYRAANLTVHAAAGSDDRLTGRVRRVTRPDACEFCRLIADRGYTPARAGFSAHAHCGCTAEPQVARPARTRLRRVALRSRYDNPARPAATARATATGRPGAAAGPATAGPAGPGPGPGAAAGRPAATRPGC